MFIVEACMGLSIAIIGVVMLTNNLRAGDKLLRESNRDVDQALATKMMRENNLKEITLHDKIYRDQKKTTN